MWMFWGFLEIRITLHNHRESNGKEHGQMDAGIRWRIMGMRYPEIRGSFYLGMPRMREAIVLMVLVSSSTNA